MNDFDANRQEVYQGLVETVDLHETNKSNERVEEDWSNQVEAAINEGEQNIRSTVTRLCDYLDDPSAFLEEKLLCYEDELMSIEEMIWETEQINIESVIADILDEFGCNEELMDEEISAENAILDEIIDLLENENSYWGEYFIDNSASPDYFDGAPFYVDPRMYEGALYTPQQLQFSFEYLMGQQSYEMVILYIPLLLEQPHGEEMLKQLFEGLITKENGLDALRLISYKVPDFGESPYVMEALKNLVSSSNPELLAEIWNHFKYWENNPEALAFLQEFVQRCLYEHPITLITHYDKYATLLPNSDEVVLAAVHRLASQSSLSRLVLVIDRLENGSDELLEQVLEIIADQEPILLLSNFSLSLNHYPNSDYIQEAVYDSLLERHPQVALKYSADSTDRFFDPVDLADYREQAIRAMARLEPQLLTPDIYENEPFADEIRLVVSEGIERRDFILSQLRRIYDGEHDDEALMNDPALARVHVIERDWLPSMTDLEFADMASYICRNLYLQNELVTYDSVVLEYEAISKARSKYEDVSIFHGRNIVMASHSEQWNFFSDRFGRKELIEVLKDQQGAGCAFDEFEATENTQESIKKAMDDTLQAIRTTPSPMTFIFQGHGSPNGLYFSDGTIEDGEIQNSNYSDTCISPTELANALIQRCRSFGKEAVAQDILIFDCCYNHDFLRNVYDQLAAYNYQMPIAIGESEYGQMGYSFRESETNSLLFDQVMHMDEERRAVLGDLWKPSKYRATNPSLYAPTAEGYKQLAKNEFGDDEVESTSNVG
ncbi:hypothetical protein HN748_06510 [Candidatus Peregrinibacteria bacterium]|jgi:hypothetical protein|nr:hypothetical protein [Candidatus Peregrinibacteria bacterium]MBT7484283.1 hypothetical protein [Candidatus Peregrinibacteria bacterium]MBT7703854.1 hypothetical protein [Candidatus Peregrinibacteria bacterium]